MATRIVLIAVGIVLGILTTGDVFQSVIVPRAVGVRLRPSYYLWRLGWLIWPRLAWRMHPRDHDRREDFLALFAPLTLILMLLLWSTLMLIAFGCVSGHSRFDASADRVVLGSRVLCGNVVLYDRFRRLRGQHGVDAHARAYCGRSGFMVVSTTTAFLFAVFGAFQAREQFVVVLSSRAASPPSGIGLLVVAARADLKDRLPAVMADAQKWTASLMETHLAYPVLAYLRSSHDNQSWVGTQARCWMRNADDDDRTRRCGRSAHPYDLGRHATNDLCRYFSLDRAGERRCGITREEFDRAARSSAFPRPGYEMHDRERAWRRFSTLRCA